MASAHAFAKLEKKPKFPVRHRNRCRSCGRSRAYYRKFELCRICLRSARAARRDPGRHQVELVGASTMTTDPIADMLTRIRNAPARAPRAPSRCRSPSSRCTSRRSSSPRATSRASRCSERRPPAAAPSCSSTAATARSAIVGMRRASRPGRRVYVGHTRFRTVLSGMGISIISTSRGVLTDSEARTQSHRRRAAVRGLVMTAANSASTSRPSRASASARSGAQGRRGQGRRPQGHGQGPEGQLARELPEGVKVELKDKSSCVEPAVGAVAAASSSRA